MAKNPAIGAPEPEVTPEMIQAGLVVLYDSGAVDVPIEDNDKNLMRRIFLAMIQASRS